MAISGCATNSWGSFGILDLEEVESVTLGSRRRTEGDAPADSCNIPLFLRLLKVGECNRDFATADQDLECPMFWLALVPNVIRSAFLILLPNLLPGENVDSVFNFADDLWHPIVVALIIEYRLAVAVK